MHVPATLDPRNGGHGVIWWICAFVSAFITYLILLALYNIHLHPLSSYPGPRLAAATRLWYCYFCTSGRLPFAVHRAHEKYGDVVRIAPNELSYIGQKAWNDIYGHRIGKNELMKDPIFLSSLSSGPGSILSANRARHGHLRKQASHGFSDRAMRSQEHVISKYADLMLDRLEKSVASGKPTVNIVDWFNFFTFDVMGDLVFGQSFECLANWGYHPWVELIFDSIKAGSFVKCVKYWPFLSPLAKWLVPADVLKRRVEQQGMVAEKAAFRKSIDDGRQDLISGYLLPDAAVTPQEYQNTVAIFILAGSETTATLMSGLIYYLLKDTVRMDKLKTEVRNAFSTSEEINVVNVNKLRYLLACLDEALRIYPPTPDTFPRNTGPTPEMICGKLVPSWTVLGVQHWSTNHSSRNFRDPDKFIPERWLEDKTGYETDQRDAVQPFSVGPRKCLGRNLAYFEMRILIARLLWRFDLELEPRSEHWNQHKVFFFWEKPPMFVKLVPRDARVGG